jgi:LPXTG-motif cell wall-anchored protein
MNMTSYRNLYKKFVFILVVIFTLSMFSGLTFAVNDPSGTLSAWRTSWQTGRINGDEGENLTFRYIPGDLTKEISIQLDYISKNSQIIGLDSSSSWFISKSSDLPLNEIINDTNILKFTPIVNGPSFISNSGSGILEYTVSFPSNLPSLTSNEKWALYFTSHLSETGTENKFLGNGAEVVEGSSYWPGKSLQLTANGNTIAIGVGDLIKNPALSVKKSSPTESITEAGQVVPYTFEVENTGNVDLTNVVVSDPLLDAEPVLSSGDDGDRVLEVDEVWTYTGNHTVTAAELENETLDNTVSVTCAQVGPVSDSLSIPINYDTEQPPQPNPAFTVEKSSPTESITEAGQVVPYTFEVENIGNVDLTDVVVSDPLLDAEPVLSSGDDGDRVLEVDEVWTYTGNHTVTAAELENETLDNTVSVTCAQVGPVSDSLSIPIDIPEIKDDDDDDDDDDDGDDDGDDGDTPTTLVVESAVLPFLEVHAGEIPQTGDTGNAPFAAGGLLFLLFAGLGLYGWFRKEQNVAES